MNQTLTGASCLILFVALGCSSSSPRSHANGSVLEPLFELALTVRPKQGASLKNVKPAGSKLIASGDGQVTGRTLSGRVVWDFYEVQGAAHCQSDLFGEVTTDTGDVFTFHARGALIVDGDDGKIWHNTSSVVFNDLPAQLAHLRRINAVLEGVHDLNTYTMRHRVFAIRRS